MKSFWILGLLILQFGFSAQANEVFCQPLFLKGLKNEFLDRTFLATFEPHTDPNLKSSGLGKPNFRVMSFEEIPLSHRPQLSSDVPKDFNAELLQGISSSIQNRQNALTAEHERFIKLNGHVELTDVFLTYDSVADLKKMEIHEPKALHYTPAILGFLRTGEPVMVVLLSGDRGDFEVPTLRYNEADTVLSNSAMASALGLGTRFYGIQKLNESLFGVVVGLPERGLPLQFEGSKYLNEKTLLQALRRIQNMSQKGLNAGRGFDWRPYITISGEPQMFPTSLSDRLQPSILSFNSWSIAHQIAKSMGLEFNKAALSMSIRPFEIAYGMPPFLEMAFSRDPSKNLLRNFFTYLFTTERPVYNQLLTIALRSFEFESRPDFRREKADNWQKELQRHSQIMGSGFADAATLAVPFANQMPKPITGYKNLVPHDFVTMKVIDLNAADWKRTSEIPRDVHIVAELVRTQVTNDFKRLYHFRTIWRSDQGEVNGTLILSDQELTRLVVIAFEKNDLKKYLKPLEEKRKRPNVDVSYLIKAPQTDANVVARVLRQSEKMQLSPSHAIRNGSGSPQVRLPEQSSARQLVNMYLSEHDGTKYKSHLAYHTIDRDYLILNAPDGALEVRTGKDYGKVAFQLPASELVGIYKDDVRKILHVGQKYFVTSEHFKNEREAFVVRRISDGVEIARSQPDGFVSIVFEPNEMAVHIVGLDYIDTVLLPSGTQRWGPLKPNSDQERASVKAMAEAYNRVKSDLSVEQRSGYMTAMHLSADGKFAYIATKNSRIGSLVAIVRRSTQQILDIIDSGIDDLREIHSSDDNKDLVFRGLDRREKVPQQTVFRRNDLYD